MGVFVEVVTIIKLFVYVVFVIDSFESRYAQTLYILQVILLSALVSFLCRNSNGWRQGTVDLDQIRRAAKTFTAEKTDAG